MADKTANSTVTTSIIERRAGSQHDTCASIVAKNYTFTMANGSFDVDDTISLGLAPDGCVPILAVVSTSANFTATATMQFGLADAANGANAVALLATAANVTTTGASVALPANTVGAARAAATDKYLVAIQGVANNTANATITATVQWMPVTASAAKFSTYTN